VPPERSAVRATAERMAFWDAQARALGHGPEWRLSDAALEDSRRAMLGRWRADEPLWVFGYGSLLWDPGFHFTEVRRADVEGFQRRFSMKVGVGRGTPERPALMLGLDAGGRCQGLAFRIDPARLDAESAAVWRREMIQGHYRPVRHAAMTPQGPIEALMFGSNTGHAQYVGELPLAEAAAIIATAQGLLGSNRDYLETLVASFAGFGIEEPYLERLLRAVRRLGGNGGVTAPG